MLLAGVLSLLLLRAEPDACRLSFDQGRQQFNERHFDLAAPSFERALKLCPDAERLSLLLQIARSQLVAQRVSEALRTIERALGVDPRNTAALKVQSDARYLLGHDEAAAQPLLAARRIDPKNPEFPYALGRIYYQQHRYADAVPLFQEALALDSKSYKAYERWLKRAAELDTRYAEPHYLLAQAYKKQGAEADALRELDQFKRLASSQPRERK